MCSHQLSHYAVTFTVNVQSIHMSMHMSIRMSHALAYAHVCTQIYIQAAATAEGEGSGARWVDAAFDDVGAASLLWAAGLVAATFFGTNTAEC